MKLLFDQNLSHRLAMAVSGVFPEARHVREFGLQRADDDRVWRFALASGYALVSKDADFLHRALLETRPAKCIYLRLGNRPTFCVGELLLRRQSDVLDFLADPALSVLILE